MHNHCPNKGIILDVLVTECQKKIQAVSPLLLLIEEDAVGLARFTLSLDSCCNNVDGFMGHLKKKFLDDFTSVTLFQVFQMKCFPWPRLRLCVPKISCIQP